jgi:immune inhibitor A
LPRLCIHRSGFFLVVTAALAFAAAPVHAVMPTPAGTVPTAVVQAFERGLFWHASAPDLQTSSFGPTWKVPIILVDFPDQPLTYNSAAVWEQALFDSTGATPTGSVYDYYRWVSGNRLRVTGKVVAVIHLDNPKSYYANNSWGLSSSTPQNSYGVIDEALRKCSSSIDWSEFDQDLDGYVDMVWVLHSGMGGENIVTRQDLWSITSRMTQWNDGGAFRTNDLVPGTGAYERIDAFSVLPEMSALHPGAHAEIGTFCHEFGHALGLPDLYDTAPLNGLFNAGPGYWSLMSSGAYGGDGASPQYPSHLGAWAASYLGWAQKVRPTEDTTMVLGPLERGAPVLDVWFQGEPSSEHFLVENRQRQGFDRNLPGQGLVVYQVDDAAITSGIPSNHIINSFNTALRLVEGDGGHELMNGQSRGDAWDPMPGASGLTRWDDDTHPNSRSVFGNVTHVAMSDIQATNDSMRFRLQVRPRGWLPAHAFSSPPYVPVVGGGPATRAVMLADSSLVAVSSEFVSGHPQVVLRTRRADRAWEPAMQVSQSPGGATDPSVAALPGGDLCVVWSDSRDGANELYFRSRVLGVWSAERRLTQLVGHSKNPCLGADAFGGVHLTWLYNEGGAVYVYFMYFPYLSPNADPIPVTRFSNRPDPPALAVAPDGSSYLVWPDRSTTPTSILYAHFAPDSGLRPINRLTPNLAGTLSTLNAVVDRNGTLHYVWQVAGSGGSEIRYQNRGNTTSEDTTIVQRGESVQSLGLGVAPDGGIHVVMEATTGGITQILYKEWRSNGGWDVGATEVSRTSEGVATLPMVLPRRAGSVTVLYTGYPAGAAAFMERDRNLLQQPLTAVAETPLRKFTPWSALPNPIRAGQRLRLRGGSGPGLFEVFDIGGRLVGSGESHREGSTWSVEIPSQVTRDWRSGVYFARLRGGNDRARIVVLR